MQNVGINPLRIPLTDESYKKWRETIPYTDEEIIKVLNDILVRCPARSSTRTAYQNSIDKIRAGRLSAGILNLATPFLVKTCAICAKGGKVRKAIYHIGTVGRCSEHRLISTPVRDAIRREIDEQYSLKNAEFYRVEMIRKAVRVHRVAKGHRKSSPSEHK
jgi:hypothetical protein